MTSLPNSLRQTPRVFYASGLIYFIGSIALTHIQFGSMLPADNYADGVRFAGLLQSWLVGLAVGGLLAGVGVLARVLIAICDDLRMEIDR